MRTDKYPKSISEWGLPDNINGALQWDNGRTYFFQQGQYWRFNDRRFAIDRSSKPFPRSTGPWWFGCPQTRPLHNDEEEANVLFDNDNVIQYSEDNEIDNNYLAVGNEQLDVDTSY